MSFSNQHIEELKAYEDNLLEDLTVNDALILITVCAAKEKINKEKDGTNDAKHIAAQARRHPIFSGLEDSIDPSVNKFMNMVESSGNVVKPLISAIQVLDSEKRKIAFSWAVEIIMPDGVLSEDRKIQLNRYANLLEIDEFSSQQILAKEYSWECS
jgi:hypothetical protein